jgi:hypothetical protein
MAGFRRKVRRGQLQDRLQSLDKLLDVGRHSLDVVSGDVERDGLLVTHDRQSGVLFIEALPRGFVGRPVELGNYRVVSMDKKLVRAGIESRPNAISD